MGVRIFIEAGKTTRPDLDELILSIGWVWRTSTASPLRGITACASTSQILTMTLVLCTTIISPSLMRETDTDCMWWTFKKGIYANLLPLFLDFGLFLVFCLAPVIALHPPLNQNKINSCHQDITSPTCYPLDCKDVYDSKFTANGVYWIFPNGHYSAPVQVYCDMTTRNGPWTVFQKRFDGSENFYRGWQDYKTGFGRANSEYWLGLENIHRITSQRYYRLRIELTDFDDDSRFAYFNNFSLSNERDDYRLYVVDFQEGNLCKPIGDSLTFHNGMGFSTYDHDRDMSSGNCAIAHKGAFWYFNCQCANLNGLYLRGPTNQFAMTWYTWRGYYYSMKITELKIAVK
ncbi:microfibril-associated glycoprotein 4-like isoform X2 [Lithobates pipiens]